MSRPLEADIQLDIQPGDSFPDKQPARRPWGVSSLVRWSIYLLIAGFCLYRISVFRPIPLDDSTGALRPLLYRGLLGYLGLFANPGDAFLTWSQLCLAGLVTVALLAAINFAWSENLLRLPDRVAHLLSSRALFWSLLAFTLLLCRVPALLKGELNPDESQFLASAQKLFYDPNFFRSVDCGTSGPLNIFPLMLPAIVGLSPDLASSRLIAVIAVFLSIFFLYRALTIVGNERLARLAVLPVAGTFALFRQGELVHYSSEHIPFLLVSLSLYQGARVLTAAKRHVMPNFFWIGFLASAAYFTKMQAIPIILSIGAVSFAHVCSTGFGPKVWRSVWSGCVGVLVPILCVVVVCLQGGVLGDFWRTYVRANMNYANAVNPYANLLGFADYLSKLAEVHVYLFTVFAIVVAYLIAKRRRSASEGHTYFVEMLVASVAISASVLLSSVEKSSVYAYLVILCICAAPVYFLVLWGQRSFQQDPVRWFGLLAFVSSAAALYSVYKPHRYFAHYLLFLYIPLSAVVGYLFIREHGSEECLGEEGRTSPKFRLERLVEGRFTFLLAALVLTISSEAYLWQFQDPKDLNAPSGLASAEGYLIRYLTSPGMQIFVWGWNLNPYFSSGRVPATRDTTVVASFQSYSGTDSPAYVPTPALERLSSIYRKRMLRDLQAHPPALFIDAVGPTSWFLRQREYWGFELVPSIKEFVDRRYVHLIDIYGQRYFMRRDLVAKREAEFSRPMPRLNCSASAVRCSDHAITLPTELPATNIPQHARIDVEYMPIHDQLGAATVFNTEKTPFSFRGLRLQYVKKDRYILVVGVGDGWVTSKEFSAPRDKVAMVSILLNGTTATLDQNGVRIDELHLPHSFADAGGPVNVASWIGGADPFSGNVQFLQVVDLDSKQSGSSKLMGRAR